MNMLAPTLFVTTLLLPSVSRPLCQRHAPPVMKKPTKFEEDAARFASGIFQVAAGAKDAAKLRKLEEEVKTLDKFVVEKLGEADEVVETTKKKLRAKSVQTAQAKGAAARAEARTDVVSEQRDAAAALAAEAEETAKAAQEAQAKAEAERGSLGSKCPPWQRPSSAPVPPQGAPGGSGQLSTSRVRPGHWAFRHRLGGSSELPPKSPVSPPLTIQARPV